jgi:hypothetical protein
MPASEISRAWLFALTSDVLAAQAGFHGRPVPTGSWALMGVAVLILALYTLPEFIADAYWRGRAAADALRPRRFCSHRCVNLHRWNHANS